MIDKEGFAKRLDELMRQRGLNAKQLADMAGVNASTISRWKNKEEMPRRDSLQKIAKALGTTVYFLETGNEKPRGSLLDIVDFDKAANSAPSNLKEDLEFQYRLIDEFVFVYKARTKLSGGPGNFSAPEDFYPECYAFRRDWISTIASSPDNVMLMEVEGTSMEPLLEHGDVVMVDRGQNEVKDGLLYAIAERFTTEEWLLRVKIIYDKRDTWQVKSLNSPAGGPMIEEYPKEDVWVIGRVVWLARELVKGKGL